MLREKGITRHALGSCFYACRCPETAAHFRATCTSTGHPSRRAEPPSPTGGEGRASRPCSRLSPCRLRCGEPRDRHAEGRAGHIIQPDLFTEPYGCGVAAVFAANPELD